MTIIDQIQSTGRTAFSFEVLPPLKGMGITHLFRTIEQLMPFGPAYINITTHRSEYVYKDVGDGLLQRQYQRRRPGTVAVAAAIQQKFGVPVVPHILCSGFTREDTEYVLLDLQFLGITNLLVLRGDKAKDEPSFRPTGNGYAHTVQLQGQINRFNEGFFDNGDPIREPGVPFSYGVACYPEKHEEAPNAATDLQWFKRKVELGAAYGVTQMFFDNAKYFDFVSRARLAGIDVPIIPGIKPLTRLSQVSVVPKTFRCDLPEDLTAELLKCKTDDDVKQVGVEWAIAQCRELIAQGVPSIHFYSMSAAESVSEIARQVY